MPACLHPSWQFNSTTTCHRQCRKDTSTLGGYHPDKLGWNLTGNQKLLWCQLSPNWWYWKLLPWEYRVLPVTTKLPCSFTTQRASIASRHLMKFHLHDSSQNTSWWQDNISPTPPRVSSITVIKFFHNLSQSIQEWDDTLNWNFSHTQDGILKCTLFHIRHQLFIQITWNTIPRC